MGDVKGFVGALRWIMITHVGDDAEKRDVPELGKALGLVDEWKVQMNFTAPGLALAEGITYEKRFWGAKPVDGSTLLSSTIHDIAALVEAGLAAVAMDMARPESAEALADAPTHVDLGGAEFCHACDSTPGRGSDGLPCGSCGGTGEVARRG